jgi:hypothetical protein
VVQGCSLYDITSSDAVERMGDAACHRKPGSTKGRANDGGTGYAPTLQLSFYSKMLKNGKQEKLSNQAKTPQNKQTNKQKMHKNTHRMERGRAPCLLLHHSLRQQRRHHTDTLCVQTIKLLRLIIHLCFPHSLSLKNNSMTKFNIKLYLWKRTPNLYPG